MRMIELWERFKCIVIDAKQVTPLIIFNWVLLKSIKDSSVFEELQHLQRGRRCWHNGSLELPPFGRMIQRSKGMWEKALSRR